MLLTDTDFLEKYKRETLYARGQTYHPRKLPDCAFYLAHDMLKISWKSIDAFSCNIANRQTNKQTNLQTNKDENISAAFGGGNNVLKLEFQYEHWHVNMNICKRVMILPNTDTIVTNLNRVSI